MYGINTERTNNVLDMIVFAWRECRWFLFCFLFGFLYVLSLLLPFFSTLDMNFISSKKENDVNKDLLKESFIFPFPSMSPQMLQIFYRIISGMSLGPQENKQRFQGKEAWTWKCLRKQRSFCCFTPHWLVSQWDNYNGEIGRKMVQLYLISSSGCWLF